MTTPRKWRKRKSAVHSGDQPGSRPPSSAAYRRQPAMARRVNRLESIEAVSSGASNRLW